MTRNDIRKIRLTILEIAGLVKGVQLPRAPNRTEPRIKRSSDSGDFEHPPITTYSAEEFTRSYITRLFQQSGADATKKERQEVVKDKDKVSQTLKEFYRAISEGGPIQKCGNGQYLDPEKSNKLIAKLESIKKLIEVQVPKLKITDTPQVQVDKPHVEELYGDYLGIGINPTCPTIDAQKPPTLYDAIPIPEHKKHITSAGEELYAVEDVGIKRVGKEESTYADDMREQPPKGRRQAQPATQAKIAPKIPETDRPGKKDKNSPTPEKEDKSVYNKERRGTPYFDARRPPFSNFPSTPQTKRAQGRLNPTPEDDATSIDTKENAVKQQVATRASTAERAYNNNTGEPIEGRRIEEAKQRDQQPQQPQQLQRVSELQQMWQKVTKQDTREKLNSNPEDTEPENNTP